MAQNPVVWSPARASTTSNMSLECPDSQQKTTGDNRLAHHFFGYYGTCPWNANQTLHLVLRTNFDHRLPRAGERAVVCVIYLNGRLHYITDTAAWNLQQGAMQQWCPGTPNDKIVLNDIIEGKVLAKIVNATAAMAGKPEEAVILERPIAAVDPNRDVFASLDYVRVGHFRPVCRYPGLERQPWASPLPAPADDGVWVFTPQPSSARLVASMKEVRELSSRIRVLTERNLWLNHVVFSKDGTRLLFLARYQKSPRLRAWSPFDTAMFTVGVNGSHLRKVIDWGRGVSHFGWMKRGEIIATFTLRGPGKQHVVFQDKENPDYTVLSENLAPRDGHPSDSPDGNWVVTDTYTTRHKTRCLYLVRRSDGTVTLLGEFRDRWTPSGFNTTRCDLHPRWSRDGKRISFDSVMEGTRQVYVIELQDIA